MLTAEACAAHLLECLKAATKSNRHLSVYVEGEFAGKLTSATAEDGNLVLKYEFDGDTYSTDFLAGDLRSVRLTPKGLRGLDSDGEPIEVD